MRSTKGLWRTPPVTALAALVTSLTLASCADEITRSGTASGSTAPPSAAVSAWAPVLAVAAPPTFVFVSRGGVGLLDHDFKCDATNSSVTHAVGFVRRSTGPASSSHIYQFHVTSNTQISYNAHIEVYVVGPPGTRYHIDRFLSASVSASLAPPVSGYDRAKASITNPQIGVDFVGRAGNASQSSGRRDPFDGVSGSRTISCFGTTYSSAIAIGWNIQATVWDYGAESDDARGSAHSTLQASYSGYIPGRDPVPPDMDGDGVPDSVDQCGGTPAGSAVDAFGCSRAQVDSDGDKVCNPGVVSSWCTGTDDNCPSVANPDQKDSDHDGVGDACDPDQDCPTPVLNVLLPAVSGGIVLRYSSENLGIDFNAVPPSPALGERCKYLSNQGTLQGLADLYSWRSSTQATLTIFQPASQSVAPIPSWDFLNPNVVNNGRLLNGPFAQAHWYARWDSPGFEVEFLNTGIRWPRPIPGPLTYWIDLTNLGLSPSTTADVVVRRVEAYLHIELSKRVLIPIAQTLFPLDVTALIRALYSGLIYNRSSRTFSGNVQLVNTSNQAITGPLWMVITNLPSGVSLVNRSGVVGSDPYISVDVASLGPGQAVTIPVVFNNPGNARISYEVKAQAGPRTN
jgi:hypothetical protein